MVDATVGPDSIETRDDLDDGDAGLYEYWMGQEAIAEREERGWIKRARQVVKRYRDERPDSTQQVHKFNVLWSNVQTLIPALYARTPKADVQRRFKDQDDAGRLASTLLERCISFALDPNHGSDFDDVMAAVVEDRLLPGRATARVVYVPHYGETLEEGRQTVGDGAGPEFEATNGAAGLVDNPGDEGRDGLREVVYEEAQVVYVFWEDYREGPARKWRDVPWVRYRAYMTRDELVARFGKKKGARVNLDYTPKGSPESARDEPPRDIFKKAVVHEYWDKIKKRVVWLAPGTSGLILDDVDDPLGLPGFFPSAPPLLATTTNDKRIPVPDFCEYQDQARELDTLTARIDRLTRALKVAGVYAGDEKQVLQQLLDEGTENRLIPVADWTSFAMDKGGIEKLIAYLPIQQIAQTLIQLYDARDKTKQVLYELTGIGDVMRGDTQPNETAAAQRLKTSFITRRVIPQQRAVATFARNMIRLIASVVAGQFEPATISAITGYPQLVPVPALPPMPPQMLPAAPAQPQPSVIAGQTFNSAPTQPNPAYAQWQQAMAERQAVIQANQQKQQQFDAAVALIKKDGIHGFRLDIEADSTIAPDEQAEQQSRVEFLQQMVPLLENVIPLAQGNPPIASLAREIVLFAARGFRVARPLEESIEQAFDAISQMPPNPKVAGEKAGPQQNPAVEQAKIQADVHDTNVKAQVAQQQIAQKQQQAAMQAQVDLSRDQAEDQRSQAQLMLDAAALQQRERLSTLRGERLEGEMAGGLK